MKWWGQLFSQCLWATPGVGQNWCDVSLHTVCRLISMRLIVVSFLCVLIALKKTNMKAELNYVSKQTVKPNAKGWQIGVNVKATMSLFTFALSTPPFFVHLIVVFCTSHCLLHISLSFAHLIVFCTSYCFALFYFIAHFILISPFLTICMPLCYVTYIICILIVLHCHWADLIRLHFTSSYALYNYYVTNKETLTLTLTSLWYRIYFLWIQYFVFI